jgi:uncharacterized Zn finger protein
MLVPGGITTAANRIFKEQTMAEPKCPDCGATGVDKIVSTPSKESSRTNTAWFYVSHCDECGHVYGVFTKHVFGNSGPQLIVDRG